MQQRIIFYFQIISDNIQSIRLQRHGMHDFVWVGDGIIFIIAASAYQTIISEENLTYNNIVFESNYEILIGY